MHNLSETEVKMLKIKILKKLEQDFIRGYGIIKIILDIKSQIDFYNFITHEFDFFSERYLEICNAAKNFRDELKHIFYIDVLGVPDSFYCSLLMAPLLIDDDADIINKKNEYYCKIS